MSWLASHATLSTTTPSTLTSTTTLPTTPTRLSRLFRFAFLFGLVYVFSNVIPTVSAFTFRFRSAPSQCASTTVVWTPGTPPYKILLLPIGFQPEGVETRIIFEKSASGTEMNFTFPFPANSKFVAVMSDATGFGAGGTSPILTVGSSSSSSCLPTTPSQPDFYLYLSSPTLNQCSPIHVSWDHVPNPPVTVYGVIPQGQSFDFGAAERANGGSGFNWTVNVKSGTQFFFVAGDANGSGKGGSTDATAIGGGSSACINANSPGTTPDSGCGGTGPLPGASGGSDGASGPTLTGSGGTTATPTGSSNNGDGNSGDGNQDGGNGGGNDGNGSGNGGGNDPGSGGGTVVGPFQSTDAANSANIPNHRSKIGLIIGLILGILALCAAVFAAFLLWKRHERQKERRDNQHMRLLSTSEVSDVHLPAHSEQAADLPHPRPPYFSKPWAGPSLENLGSSLRVTPFPWPLNRSGSSSSPTSPRAERDRSASRPSRGADTDREGLVSGTSSARPVIESRATSSSSMMRRIRSTRFGASGFGFGTPSSGAGGGYGSSGGYRSLGDSGYNTTPSSNPPNPTGNTSSSLFGFSSGNVAGRNSNTTPNDSQYSGLNGPVHKSPLPTSYQSRQPSSDENPHGNLSQNPFNDPSPLPFALRGTDDSLVRPGSTPSGPRPPPGMPMTPGELRGLRPGMARADTSGSVWEVPPTYSSLRRKNGHEE